MMASNDLTTITVDCDTGEQTEAPITPELAEALAGVQADQVAADWETVRAERNARLTATDWIVNPPADWLALDSARAAEPYALDWNAYRQALRDIPQTFTDPSDVFWPDPPPEPQLIVS
jgi:hypothetical protein